MTLICFPASQSNQQLKSPLSREEITKISKELLATLDFENGKRKYSARLTSFAQKVICDYAAQLSHSMKTKMFEVSKLSAPLIVEQFFSDLCEARETEDAHKRNLLIDFSFHFFRMSGIRVATACAIDRVELTECYKKTFLESGSRHTMSLISLLRRPIYGL